MINGFYRCQIIFRIKFLKRTMCGRFPWTKYDISFFSHSYILFIRDQFLWFIIPFFHVYFQSTCFYSFEVKRRLVMADLPFRGDSMIIFVVCNRGVSVSYNCIVNNHYQESHHRSESDLKVINIFTTLIRKIN